MHPGAGRGFVGVVAPSDSSGELTLPEVCGRWFLLSALGATLLMLQSWECILAACFLVYAEVARVIAFPHPEQQGLSLFMFGIHIIYELLNQATEQ